METRVILPSKAYRQNLWIIASLIAVAILLGSLVLGLLISLDNDPGFKGAVITIMILNGLNFLWYIPTMVWVPYYHKSLRYEVHREEMIVYGGVLTKKVKHVPFRTVTNITIKQGLIERALGLGTLQIQTAGMSGQSGEPEQSLVGLDDVHAVYNLVANELHRFHGALSPTQAETDTEPSALDSALLDEVRAIRALLEREQG